MTENLEDTTKLIEIGYIVKPHGLKGELKLKLHAPESNLILNIDKIYVDNQIFKIDYSKKVSNGILLKFVSKNTRLLVANPTADKFDLEPKSISNLSYRPPLINSL